MKVLDININELRSLVNQNRDYQNVVINCLLKSYENKFILDEKPNFAKEGKSALLSIMLIIFGEVKFPEYIFNRLKLAGKIGRYDTTQNDNFKDVALEFFNVKLQENKFVDFYFADLTLTRIGGDIGKSKKGLSQKRKDELNSRFLNMTLDEIFIELLNQTQKSTILSESKKEKKLGALLYAKNLLIQETSEYDRGSRDENDIVSDIKADIAETEKVLNSNLSGTEKQQIVLARVGQGKFRDKVLQRNRKCPFTGITESCLLIASHIKPWKISNPSEKVDEENGLALSPTFDHLFDKGFISFSENKELLISSQLDEKTCVMLGIKEKQVIEDLILGGQTIAYMKYHRENVFRM